MSGQHVYATRFKLSQSSISSCLNRHWRPIFMAGIPKVPIFSRIHHGDFPRHSATSRVVNSFFILASLRRVGFVLVRGVWQTISTKSNGGIMNQRPRADLVLSNGAEVEFKVGQDVSGNPVISYLQIHFPRGRDIPQGGISATLLRELTIGELLALWFSESSRSFLSKREEKAVWEYLHRSGGPSGRVGLPPTYYACLSYMYVKQCELTPGNPTAEIAQRLQVSPKTISTRLARAREIGVLTGRQDGSSVTRAGGTLTSESKTIIAIFIKENM